MKYVWVIEMSNPDHNKGEWIPTVGCGLSREQARAEKKFYWEFNHPEYKYRVKKYVRE